MAKEQSYGQYVARVKKLGAKTIADPLEYARIQRRLRRQRAARKDWVKKLKKNVKKELTTEGTKWLSEKLRKQGGLTEKEIRRLRGKK